MPDSRMPDSRMPDPRMPDAGDPHGRAPRDWREAFAALPPETPPADAWSRLSARLDARGIVATAVRRPVRSRFARKAGWLGVAAAAALALVVAWPRHDVPVTDVHGAGALAAAEAPTVDAGRALVREREREQAPASTPTPASMPASGADAADAQLAGTRVPRHAAADAIALPKAIEAARKPQLAVRDAATADDASLDALYAESARLETLLALARDDRVASAGAALIAAELDAQVAGIDVELAQPGLDATRRNTLWQARVDALRQAAGFESTQRLLAAQGDVGALLVSVD